MIIREGRRPGAFLAQHWGFLACLAASLTAYGQLVRLAWRTGSLRGGSTPQTIGWYLLAFAAYIGLLLWAERRPVPLRWAWAAAIGFRLLLLLTTPTLSDDVYRYLWDGHVANHGVSPYQYAIEAPALDFLDVPVRAQANNTWMASPYLPVAQLVFAAVTAVFPLRPIFMQAVMVLFDLLSAALLARLLAVAGLPPRRLLLYLWQPLVIVEVAHGAHVDALMVWLSLLAVTFTLAPAPRPVLTGVFRLAAPLCLAAATLTKILPLLLLPVLFWRWRWWQRLLYGVTVIALLLPAGLRAGWGLTGPPRGTGLFGALRLYAAQWNFNSGLFHWLERLLGAPGFGPPLPLAQQIAAIGLATLLLAVWLRARRQAAPRALLRLMNVPLAGYLLMTPTVNPWYALMLLAFVPALPPAADERPSRWLWAAPWLYLSAALVLSYLTYRDPAHYAEIAWVRRVEWLPTLALVLAAIAGNMRKWYKVSAATGSGRQNDYNRD